MIPCLGVIMARRKPWEVSDELWAVIEPLLPKHERRFRYPGRKRIDDRKTLQGVLFVLYTGIQWEYLPQELGLGSGPTCWRRLTEWQEAGVWEDLQRVLLDRLRAQTAWTSPVSPLMPRTCRPSGVEAAQKSARVRLTVRGRARSTTC